MQKNTWLAVVVKTISIHVSQLSGLHQKYGSQQLHTCCAFWKIISTRKLNLKFILLVRTFWHIGEMSIFHIVHEKLGAKPTSLHKEQTGMVLKGNRNS